MRTARSTALRRWRRCSSGDWSDLEVVCVADGAAFASNFVARGDIVDEVTRARGNWQRKGGKVDPEHDATQAPLRSFSMWEKLKDKEPPPPRINHIERWMPGDDVTALFGDGGKGRTQLGLQLCYCTAARMLFLGMDVRHGSAIALSAEEHDDELHFRGHQIAARHRSA